MNKLLFAFISVVVLGFAVSIHAADLPKEPFLPASPRDLLPALPATPQDWKLVASQGQNYYSEWLQTEVQRKYEQVLPPNAPASSTPEKTHVRITDTAYWPAANRMFLNTEPLDEKSGISRSEWRGMPLIEIPPADGNPLIVKLWFKKRYIMTLFLWGQKSKDAEKWLRLIDFALLEKIPDKGEKVLPQPMTIQCVDELHPEESRSFSLFRQ